MKNRLAFIILMVLVVGGAVAIRLPRLADRPMHTDEAVHAYKLGELIEKGEYRYNPVEFHGPTLVYFTLPVAWVEGIHRYADLDEFTLRIVPAIFGVLLVVLVLGVSDGLGRPAAVVAALLTACSPAMVFYSRYYIMEIMLVCFTMLTIVGAWRFIRSGSAWWAALAGAGVGLMHATKETWVLAAAAMVFALIAGALWDRWVAGERWRIAPRVWNWRIAVAAGVAVAVAVVFFSSFFTYWPGVWDSVLTYVNQFRRAGGSTGQEAGNLHVNPWYSYLRWLLWFREGRGPVFTEAAIAALALAGAVAGFTRRGLGSADAKFVRFLTFYSLAMFVGYSMVPYKTPWCVLGALHGMILLAGVGACAVVRWPLAALRAVTAGADERMWKDVRWAAAFPMQAVVVLLLAAGVWHLTDHAYLASRKLCASPYNPWVYGHSSLDIARLGTEADAIAAVAPVGHDMLIKFFSPDEHDVWPLPWYLRRFNRERIGYFHAVPADCDADMIIFVPEVWDQLKGRLTGTYEYVRRGLRPGIVLTIGVREDLWRRYIARIKADAAGKADKGKQP